MLFRRRVQDERKDTAYLGVTVTEGAQFFFECMRDVCFDLLPNEKDYARLAKTDRVYSNSAGALILPSCAVRSGSAGFGKQISFFMGESRDADDLLYQMQKYRMPTSQYKLHIKHTL